MPVRWLALEAALELSRLMVEVVWYFAAIIVHAAAGSATAITNAGMLTYHRRSMTRSIVPRSMVPPRLAFGLARGSQEGPDGGP